MLSWKNERFVAFDLETSGAYPVGNDIVEFAGVVFTDHRIEKELQFLCKPREPMSDFIIGIHGITNEMVADKKSFSEHLSEVVDFFGDAIPMAHHAPFDMGFIAWELEKTQRGFPPKSAVCTSLLSQKVIKESKNHKLQTLIKHLSLEQGTAHRALDDAKACMHVGLHCFQRLGEDVTLDSIYKKQGGAIHWHEFSLLKKPILVDITKAIESKKVLEILYQKSGVGGDRRQIEPIGIVRNPDGDWVQAKCLRDHIVKRFYISKIIDWTFLP